MRLAALLCIALLFSFRASADIPSPQVDFEFTAGISGPGLESYSSGSVRSVYDNPFNVTVGDHRLSITIERLNADDYGAEISVYRRDGSNWQELTVEPLAYSARFDAEAENTFSIGDATLRLDSVVSLIYFRIVEREADESERANYLLFGAVAMLLLLAMIALYLRRS